MENWEKSTDNLLRSSTTNEQTKSPKTASVLVAETEAISRASLSELLRDEGYLVVEADDSCSAITQMRRSPDLKIILSNVEMPAWSKIIQHARAQVPNSLILGMVRYGALPNALEAQRLGADGYLVKPLLFLEVKARIERYLTGLSRIEI